MTRGLSFEAWTSSADSSHHRMDVTCFVGFTRRSSRPLPVGVETSLRRDGWIDAPGLRTATELIEDPWHLPYLIDDWAMFEALFEPRSLQLTDQDEPSHWSYLAVAVRSFFVQGGQRCVVVPVGPPPPLRASLAVRGIAAAQLLPALAGDVAALEPYARERWRGIGVLHGVPETIRLCLPDLPYLVAPVPAWIEAEPPTPAPRDAFEQCSTQPERIEVVAAPPVEAPRCDEAHYREWARMLALAAEFVAHNRPDVQLVAAIPLPVDDSAAERDLLGAMVEWELFEELEQSNADGLASRFVQLVYPWWRWQGSAVLPGGVQPPDGAVAGMLARETLLVGTFRSAAETSLDHARGLEPELSRAQRERPQPLRRGAIEQRALIERVSLLGPTLAGLALLSDVTTSADPVWRAASIQRLHAVWLRALEHAGQTLLFEPNDARLFGNIRDHLEQVGLRLFASGALRGANPREAFQIRCDETTTSAHEREHGRVVAEIAYRPSAPLDTLRVVMALSESRRVTVLAEPGEVHA